MTGTRAARPLLPVTMRGKTCLVTGATSGLGLETARALARLGARVVIVSRNPAKCAATVDELIAETGNPAVEALAADLSSMAAVRRVACEFLGRHGHLHVLVNNAGVTLNRRVETAEGLEVTLALNHLAPFLLTNLLLGVLRASAPARVINVTSLIHGAAHLDPARLAARRPLFWGVAEYAKSKLANVLFTYELARRLVGTGVTANVLNPGMVATNICLAEGWFLRTCKRVADVVTRSLPPVQGAQPLVALAASPAFARVTGQYFKRFAFARSTRRSYDHSLQQRLWDASAHLTGLDRTASTA